MFCKKCGAPVTPEQRKCPRCGEPVPDLSCFDEWPGVPASTEQPSGNGPEHGNPVQLAPDEHISAQVAKRMRKFARQRLRVILAVLLVTMLCTLLTLVQVRSVNLNLKEMNAELAALSKEATRTVENTTMESTTVENTTMESTTVENTTAETSAPTAEADTEALTENQMYEQEEAESYTGELAWSVSAPNIMLEKDEVLEYVCDDAVQFSVTRQETDDGISYVPVLAVSEAYGQEHSLQYSWTDENGSDLTAHMTQDGTLTFSATYLDSYINRGLTLRVSCRAIWENDEGGTLTVNVGYIVITSAEQAAG